MSEAGFGKRGDQHDSGKRQQDDVRSANIVAGKGIFFRL